MPTGSSFLARSSMPTDATRSSTPTGSPTDAASSSTPSTAARSSTSTPTTAASSSSSTPTVGLPSSSSARSSAPTHSASGSSSSTSSFGSLASPTSVSRSIMVVSSPEQLQNAIANLAGVGAVSVKVYSISRLNDAGRILSDLMDAENINWRLEEGRSGLQKARTLSILLRGVWLMLEDTEWTKIQSPATAADISAIDQAELETACDDLELAHGAADGTSLLQEVLQLLNKCREVAAESRAIVVEASTTAEDHGQPSPLVEERTKAHMEQRLARLQMDDDADDVEPDVSLAAKIGTLLDRINDLMQEIDHILDQRLYSS